MTAPDRLPTLFFVRGWNETVNPEALDLVEQLRGTGSDIVDLYIAPDRFDTLGGWAAAVADEIEHRREPGEPLHLLAFCIGGNLTLVVVHELEARGAAPTYVGLIDVREDQPDTRLTRGIDALYEVPWGNRVRLQLMRIVPPDPEPVGQVLRSVARRAVRSVRELPTRGWRSRRRRNPLLFPAMRLTYGWEFQRIVTPVHRYTTQNSIERFGAGDPSLNIGQYLSGGSSITLIEGTHESCIQPPHSDHLIACIDRDRRAAAQSPDPRRPASS